MTFDNLRCAFGVAAILFICWLMSEARRLFPWRLTLGALAIQIAFLAAVFAFPVVRTQLSAVNGAVDGLQSATHEGVRFAFGYLAGGPAPFAIIDPAQTMVLAIQVLPFIIVISALSAVLWHWRVLEMICRGLGFLFEKSLGLSGPLALATAANIFLGMVEAPLTIRPYLERLTRSELFVVMTTGMGTVAGTMMAIYTVLLRPTVPDAALHILTASFMAAPASVLIARIMVPEIPGTVAAEGEGLGARTYHSTMDAFSSGSEEGVHVLISVVGMLIAAVAFVALVNNILAVAPHVMGSALTLERILGWLFAPLAWIMGAPWSEAPKAGALLGIKSTLTEFVAYLKLSQMPADAFTPRTRLMLTYALCGFASFGAAAIMVGGLSAVCPGRRAEIAALGLKSMIAGTLTTTLTGALVGASYGLLSFD